MKIKNVLVDFVVIFVLVLVVASVVGYLWNLIFHATGTVDWETSFRLAIILGIVFTWMKAREGEQKRK